MTKATVLFLQVFSLGLFGLAVLLATRALYHFFRFLNSIFVEVGYELLVKFWGSVTLLGGLALGIDLTALPWWISISIGVVLGNVLLINSTDKQGG